MKAMIPRKVCPVARLIRDGQNAWRQDLSFIPPVASFGASPVLHERLMLLNRQLRSRRQRLMTMRRESNERLADFAVADVSLFWLLNALNSHATVLAEYERFPSRPPEQVWAELARLAGSMLTFSWTMIWTPYRVMTTRSQLRRFLRCLT